jgi:two-component system, OmpR family, response regulator RegX3
MTKRTILLIEDEEAISEPLAAALGREGFETVVAGTVARGIELFETRSPDLVLLDVMLPDGDGRDVLRRIRETSRTPVVMLTARGEEMDRVLGLELGADDYVVKPFSMAELVSRVRALLRRRHLDIAAAGGSAIAVGGIRIEPTSHQVTVDGEDVHLTPSEYKLLLLLAASTGHVFTRTQIMEHLWQTDFVGDARACDVHVANLRRKIEPDPRRPQRIVTVREAGYKLVAV